MIILRPLVVLFLFLFLNACGKISPALDAIADTTSALDIFSNHEETYENFIGPNNSCHFEIQKLSSGATQPENTSQTRWKCYAFIPAENEYSFTTLGFNFSIWEDGTALQIRQNNIPLKFDWELEGCNQLKVSDTLTIELTSISTSGKILTFLWRESEKTTDFACKLNE